MQTDKTTNNAQTKQAGQAGQTAQAGQAGQSQDEALRVRLRSAGLRVTVPRLALARLLFCRENHHFTAEALHKKTQKAGLSIALATIYNSLHQFTAAGFLRQIIVDTGHIYFDTNTSPHHHFFVMDENRLIDIPAAEIAISNLPDVPTGLEMAGVDVIIRVNNAKTARAE